MWLFLVVRSTLESLRRKLLSLLGGVIAKLLVKDSNVFEACEEEEEDV